MNVVTEGSLPSAVPEAPQRVDGRRLRSARTRQAILEAYVAVMRETVAVPTAERVARQAKLSERAVFAHFTDLETLGVAAFDYVLSLRRPVPTGDAINAGREARIRFQVGIRAKTCEDWLPLWRVMTSGNLLSQEIAKRAEMVRGFMRGRILEMYEVELATLSKADLTATVAALEFLFDFESWGRLRQFYKLSYDEACEAWIKMVGRLLPPTP